MRVMAAAGTDRRFAAPHWYRIVQPRPEQGTGMLGARHHYLLSGGSDWVCLN